MFAPFLALLLLSLFLGTAVVVLLESIGKLPLPLPNRFHRYFDRRAVPSHHACRDHPLVVAVAGAAAVVVVVAVPGWW